MQRRLQSTRTPTFTRRCTQSKQPLLRGTPIFWNLEIDISEDHVGHFSRDMNTRHKAKQWLTSFCAAVILSQQNNLFSYVFLVHRHI